MYCFQLIKLQALATVRYYFTFIPYSQVPRHRDGRDLSQRPFHRLPP